MTLSGDPSERSMRSRMRAPDSVRGSERAWSRASAWRVRSSNGTMTSASDASIATRRERTGSARPSRWLRCTAVTACNALPRGATPSTVQPTSWSSTASLAAPGHRNVVATSTLSRERRSPQLPAHGAGQSCRAQGGLGQVEMVAPDPAYLEPRQPRPPQLSQVAPEVRLRGREQRDRVVEDPRAPLRHDGQVGFLDRLAPVAPGSASRWRPRSRPARRADRPDSSRRACAGGCPTRPRACSVARRAVALTKSPVGQCRWSKNESMSPTNVTVSPASVSSRADSRARSPPKEYPSSWYGPCGCSARMRPDRLGGHRLDRVGRARLGREREGDDPWVAGESIDERYELVGRATRTGEDEQGGVAAGAQLLSPQAAHRTRSWVIRRAANSSPNMKRIMGPNDTAAESPRKYRPGTEDSNRRESTGVLASVRSSERTLGSEEAQPLDVRPVARRTDDVVGLDGDGRLPLSAGQHQPDAVLGGLHALERASGDDLDRGLERLLQVPRRARAEVPPHDLGSPPGRDEAEEIGCVAARARAPSRPEAGAGLVQPGEDGSGARRRRRGEVDRGCARHEPAPGARSCQPYRQVDRRRPGTDHRHLLAVEAQRGHGVRWSG